MDLESAQHAQDLGEKLFADILQDEAYKHQYELELELEHQNNKSFPQA